MMKTIMNKYFISLFLLISINAISQNYNNVWMFGQHAGIDFNSTPPTPFTSVSPGFDPIPPYYISSICDSLGNLLFLTDGFTTWDKNQAEIPKYLHRWPWSGFVMPLICPNPKDTSSYYIFGVSNHSYANRLEYLSVNLDQSNSAEIEYPQPSTLNNYFSILLNNASVLVAGTKACNDHDIWIVGESNSKLYSYLVTNNGVDSVPVVSSFPGVLPAGFINAAYGNMKFSASGERLIIPLKAEKKIAIFNFDNAKGIFSNPVLLSIGDKNVLEDAEISPDGSKVYFGSYYTYGISELHDVFQFDLDAGSSTAIQQTLTKVTPFTLSQFCGPHGCFIVYQTMQLAPDGKIYVSQRTVDGQDMDLFASVIQSPNSKGVDCLYKPSAFNMKIKYSIINYNYIRSLDYTAKKNGIQVKTANCKDQPAQFSLLYKNIDSVKWNFGDEQSGENNYSSNSNPQHIYPNPGTYIATAVIYTRCTHDTATTNVTIADVSTVHLPDYIKDSIICQGQNLVYDATSPNATSYKWNTGVTSPTYKITAPGFYSITASNSCSIDLRSFNIGMQTCDCEVFVPTAFTPNNDGLNDEFKPITKCYVNDYKFFIYNRLGQLMFTSYIPNEAWNGNLNAYPVSTGTYIWKLVYQNPNDKRTYQQSGTVTLLR